MGCRQYSVGCGRGGWELLTVMLKICMGYSVYMFNRQRYWTDMFGDKHGKCEMLKI